MKKSICPCQSKKRVQYSIDLPDLKMTHFGHLDFGSCRCPPFWNLGRILLHYPPKKCKNPGKYKQTKTKIRHGVEILITIRS